MTQEHVPAYPLLWPERYPRTKEPERSRFNISYTRAVEHLMYELNEIGAKNIVLNSNIPIRKSDGLPYANYKEPEDTGVVIYCTLHGEPKSYPCDAWDRVKDNIRALGRTFENWRANNRYKVAGVGDEQYKGFKKLAQEASKRDWWVVLGVEESALWEDVNAAYRKWAMKCHPDHGGNIAQWHELQEAYGIAKEIFGQVSPL